MNPLSTTIVALATAVGRAALGIIRLSGKDTFKIIAQLTGKNISTIKKLVPRKLYPLTIYDQNKQPLDSVLVALFFSPASYTGEDLAEIYFHGNPVIARQILNAAIRAGARPAYGGEFTYRATLNGKMDLNQAEAVYNLIHSPTKNLLPAAWKTLTGEFSSTITGIVEQLRDIYTQIEARLNYPEDEIEPIRKNTYKKVYRQILNLLNRAEPARIQMQTPAIFIVGKQNVGKSSLFNCLLKEEAALISPRPGTTRDVITRLWEWQDFTFTVADTAGMFAEKFSRLDQQAIELTRKKIAAANGLIFVLDIARPLSGPEIKFIQQNSHPTILVVNKIDLPAAWDIKLVKKIARRKKSPIVLTSAINNRGIEQLRKTIYRYFAQKSDSAQLLLIGNYAYQKLKGVGEKMAELDKKLSDNNLEVASFILEEILNDLEFVAGKTSSEEIVQQIFGRFCVGK